MLRIRLVLLTSLTLLTLLALAGCEEEAAVVVAEVCTPIADVLEPASGSIDGGDDVLLSGLFVATSLGERDVLVHIGGEEAEVTGVFRGDTCARRTCQRLTERAARVRAASDTSPSPPPLE